MALNLLRKAGVILAGAVAVVAMTAAPASASQGWFVGSSHLSGVSLHR
jgi:hypothetical protein